jgi:hypothetical protein
MGKDIGQRGPLKTTWPGGRKEEEKSEMWTKITQN